MTPPSESLVEYDSGSDVTLSFGRFRFRFSAADFRERAHAAAVRLGCVPDATPGDDELRDIAALAAFGDIAEPASDLGTHLARQRHAMVDREGDVVHWLRRLIFRGAWLDGQIKEGRIDPVFERGFRYCSASTGESVAEPERLPDWSALRFGAEQAE